jgi:hypothetical protein
MQLSEDEEEGIDSEKKKDDYRLADLDTAKVGADGLDTEWNKRMKEKLVRMKSRKMRDMSISVSQKAGLTGALASRQRRTSQGEQVTGQGRVREELSKRQGSIEFMTGDSDGTVDICMQSIIANSNNPSRFSLNVTMAPEVEEKKEEEKETDVLERDLVKTHMSRLERDLSTLTSRIKSILSSADFNKDQEVAFHEQSVAMNRAATYWPIIQLIVLLITGFTQANHIVRFMKSRHIV